MTKVITVELFLKIYSRHFESDLKSQIGFLDFIPLSYLKFKEAFILNIKNSF